jgi:hypothetical protein
VPGFLVGETAAEKLASFPTAVLLLLLLLLLLLQVYGKKTQIVTGWNIDRPG